MPKVATHRQGKRQTNTQSNTLSSNALLSPHNSNNNTTTTTTTTTTSRRHSRPRRFPQQWNLRTNSMAMRRRRTTTRGCVCQHPATEANPPREKRITRRIFLIEDTNIFTVVHFYLLYLQIVVNCLERT